jgi:hypothetical protein
MSRSTRYSPLVSVVLVSTWAATVHAAAVLSTGPVDRTGRAFSCIYVNVGNNPVTVTTEIMTTAGTLLVGETDVDVPAGIGHSTSTTGDSPRLLCRFSLAKGRRSSLRAQACVYESSSLGGACINSIDAR